MSWWLMTRLTHCAVGQSDLDGWVQRLQLLYQAQCIEGPRDDPQARAEAPTLNDHIEWPSSSRVMQPFVKKHVKGVGAASRVHGGLIQHRSLQCEVVSQIAEHAA